MKTYILKRRQIIARPLSEVFEFFSRPENLEKITPRTLGFRILTPSPISMHAGKVIDYTIRLLGIPIRWTTLISDYDPPHRFVDVALRSPYALWYHTHRFEKVDEGTVMTDEVHYALPFGLIGRVAHRLWVRDQLKRIFDYRAGVVRDILESGGPQSVTQNKKNGAREDAVSN